MERNDDKAVRRLRRGWPRLFRSRGGLLKRLAVLELVAASLLACDPMHVQFDDVEPAVPYQAALIRDAPVPNQLTVMTWNVKFAGGRIDFFFDCHGDRALMNDEEVLKHLDGLAAKIRQVNPDIVLLQEVDVDSKRCAYVDNLQYLLDHTDLNYGMYASQWRVDYVPSDGIGPVNSGNAIISRWPLTEGERIALPLIEEQDGLTQYFFLRRNILRAKVDLPSREPIWAVNVHTSAFSNDGTKKKQIDRFKEELDSLSEAGRSFVAGGDLNTLPPDSAQTSGFSDSVCEGQFDADDYGGEEDWLNELLAAYQEAIPHEDFKADNAPYFTHTTDGSGFWNRRLDYLFTNLSFHSGLVHQSAEQGGMDTMPLSDHAPVTVKLVLP